MLVLGQDPSYIVRGSFISVAFNFSCSQRITPTVNVMTGDAHADGLVLVLPVMSSFLEPGLPSAGAVLDRGSD